MAIKAISIDFWNTLFTEPAGGFEFYKERRRLLLRGAVSEALTDEQIENAFKRESGLHHSIWIEEHRTLAASERVRRVLAYLDVALPQDAMTHLTHSFEEGILERPPVLIEGVREAVEHLASRYRLGIISDVGYSPGRVLRRVLKDAGLLDHFDSMIFSDEAGRSKPHREVFERTSDALGAAPAEMVHIGDLEHTDIVGAKRAGYRAIRFTGATPMPEGEETQADHVTEDFAQVPRIIEMMDGC
ncbi:MAG: HAD family hydrolase [Acidobacteriota bacterium]